MAVAVAAAGAVDFVSYLSSLILASFVSAPVCVIDSSPFFRRP